MEYWTHGCTAVEAGKRFHPGPGNVRETGHALAWSCIMTLHSGASPVPGPVLSTLQLWNVGPLTYPFWALAALL